MVFLNGRAAQHFEQLVIGPAAETLDDGEAATIAYAAISGATAILDEKKALRIAAERFPQVPLASTVDILSHSGVQSALGLPALADVVFNAFRNGRMRVPAHHLAWVLKLIGDERAALCASLPTQVHGLLSAKP
jgi:predicted nucleic acid-binding protein